MKNTTLRSMLFSERGKCSFSPSEKQKNAEYALSGSRTQDVQITSPRTCHDTNPATLSKVQKHVKVTTRIY